jgi:UDP-glucose 4-epimerase
MVQNRIGCPEKAKRELGFEYEIELGKGLQDLIAWREENC